MKVVDTSIFDIVHLLNMIKEGETFINFGARELRCIEADESLTIPSITRANDMCHGFCCGGIVTEETASLPF